MRVLARGTAIALVSACVYITAGTAHATITQLQATPSQGHTGDPIDLSGSGFPPHTHLAIMMACPNLQHSRGNVTLQWGPWTDGQGTFAGFIITAMAIHGIRLPTPCVMYASYGNVAFANDIPGVYYIYGKSKRFSGCQAHMCVKVRARPRRVRAGYREQLSISGWPGARTQVTIAYPGDVPVTSIHHLNWKGLLTMQVPVPATGRGVVHVRVYTELTPHLSSDRPLSASSQATFTVLH